MKNLRILLSCIVLAICVAACNEELSPLTSATVSVRTLSGTVESSLSTAQLQLLSTWLIKHRSGWRFCSATPPVSDIAFSITMKHANGKKSFLELHSIGNWRTTMEASHLNGSNQSEQPCALQTFTDYDLNELRTALGVKNG